MTSYQETLTLMQTLETLVDQVTDVMEDEKKSFYEGDFTTFKTLSLKKEALCQQYKRTSQKFSNIQDLSLIKKALEVFPNFAQKIEEFDEKLSDYALVLSVGEKVRKRYLGLFKESILGVQKPHTATYTRHGYKSQLPRKNLGISLSINQAI